jgi:hypothetical protein
MDWCQAYLKGSDMFFDPFKIYDAMLGISPEDDEDYIDTVFITREIPTELEDKYNALVDNLLTEYGYDPEEFDEEEDAS